MRGFSRILLVLMAVTACAWASVAAQGGAKAGGAAKAPAGPIIVLDTVKGSIEIETFPGDAPKSVAHILELVKKEFYRGQRVHWAQPGVAQMGDPSTRDMSKQDAWGRLYGTPIGVAELSKRPFDSGTVGLAYRKDQTPLAAGSQFFILTRPNPQLNGKYTMIGKVIKGLPVVEKLEVGDMIKSASIKQ
jgi:cyclophilin family peptidyl-prolyl cis-trans isomerase